MSYTTNSPRRPAEPAKRDAPATTGIPFWDIMLSFGQAASQQALTGFGTTAATLDHKTARVAGELEVIPVGEETLHVGKRVVAGETTRIRRVVVATPVEQSVSLREERVIVERRKPTAATAVSTQGILTGTAVEMSDSYEVVESWKSARVTEEVVLRREVTLRTETVRDVVRHDEIVVEHAAMAPRPVAPPVPAAFEAVAKADRLPLAAEAKPVVARFEATATPQDKPAATVRAEVTTAKAETAAIPKAEPAKPVYAEPKSAAPFADADRNDKSGQPRKV